MKSFYFGYKLLKLIEHLKRKDEKVLEKFFKFTEKFATSFDL